MRFLIIGALVSLSAGSVVQAQTTNPLVTAPITKFIDAFNKGDMATAAATHAAQADLVIIDEVSPFRWQGADAFKAWAADLMADGKKQGITDQKVTLSPATRLESNGTDAYVVVPAVYSFKKGGVAMRESAHMTFVLKNDAAGWLIHGWAWTGPKAPTAAQGAAKK